MQIDLVLQLKDIGRESFLKMIQRGHWGADRVVSSQPLEQSGAPRPQWESEPGHLQPCPPRRQPPLRTRSF